MVRMIEVSLVALLAAMPALTQDARFASADELNENLVGNTFAGDMGSAEYTSYFGEDGTYYDASGGGQYEVTEDGICYPGTEFGCYSAQIDGEQLTWFQDGENVGSGVIMDGDALNLRTAD